MVAFLCGYEIPRYISHTTLVLIPKKKTVSKFSDLRPINLSTFMNKIISKVIHERIVKVLPRIISNNQRGFMNERSIVEKCVIGSGDCQEYNKR